MDLILDTVSTKFQVCGEFGPRLDKDGVQRRDKSGGTNLPLWAVQLVAWSARTATSCAAYARELATFLERPLPTALAIIMLAWISKLSIAAPRPVAASLKLP